LNFNDALPIGQTVFLLDSLPYLTSLQLEIVNALPGSYVSRLPKPLETALQRYGRYLTHLGVTSAQLEQDDSAQASTATSENYDHVPITACPHFQLDEQLVADAISVLPNLRFLSLHQTSYDTLSTTSPLYDSISSLAHLKRLNILDVSSFNDKWTDRALSGSLEYLSVVSNPLDLPPSCDAFIHLHRKTLKHLSVVGSSSSTIQQILPALPMSTQRYSLPFLESLELEASCSDDGTMSYLERYTDCPRLERITLKYAKSISMQDIADVIRQRRFKTLKVMEIALDGTSNSDEEGFEKLVNVAEFVGINVCMTK